MRRRRNNGASRFQEELIVIVEPLLYALNPNENQQFLTNLSNNGRILHRIVQLTILCPIRCPVWSFSLRDTSGSKWILMGGERELECSACDVNVYLMSGGRDVVRKWGGKLKMNKQWAMEVVRHV